VPIFFLGVSAFLFFAVIFILPLLLKPEIKEGSEKRPLHMDNIAWPLAMPKSNLTAKGQFIRKAGFNVIVIAIVIALVSLLLLFFIIFTG